MITWSMLGGLGQNPIGAGWVWGMGYSYRVRGRTVTKGSNVGPNDVYEFLSYDLDLDLDFFAYLTTFITL